jgi:hypothetical protein
MNTDVQHHWKDGGLDLENLRMPASIDQLRALGKTIGGELAPDFEELYLFADGFKEGCRDELGFRFWPLEEIVSVADFDHGVHGFIGADGFYLFCDYLDFSWGYAFKVASMRSLKIYVIGLKSREPVLIASSFGEFLRLYALNDERLYPE